MTLGTDWQIDDVLSFYVNTHDPTVAGAPEADADSVPTYRVYENETGTPILTGSMALLDASNTVGFYSEAITLSAANGFEAGKCYGIRINAVTSAIAQSVVKEFRMAPTFALPGQEAPTATPTLAKALTYLYKAWRNKSDFDRSTGVQQYYADNGTTVDQKMTVAIGGTTTTRPEVGSGP